MFHNTRADAVYRILRLHAIIIYGISLFVKVFTIFEGSERMKRTDRNERDRRQAVMAEKVRKTLFKRRLSQAWLIRELADRGVFTAANEMSEAINGTRHGDKIITVLEQSMDILGI